MKNLLLSVFCLVLMRAASQPTAGLVAHYTFAGNANDVSGNSLNGIVHGATLTNDQFGNPNQAYLFNGISDYIELPDNSLHLNNYTYSICMKSLALPPSVTLFDVGNTTADQYVYVANSSPYLGFACASYYTPNISPPDRMFSGTVPGINSYYHVVVIRNNDALKLFVDGVFVDSVSTHTIYPSYGTGTAYSRIGCRIDATEFFHGVIDDIAIYNRELSTPEILDLCTNPSGISSPSNEIEIGIKYSSSENTLHLFTKNSEIMGRSFDATLINALGQNIKLKEIQFSPTENITQLPLLLSGIYTIRLSNKNTEIYRAKFPVIN